MAEQKLPKLLTFPLFRHLLRKTRHETSVSFQTLGIREQNKSAPPERQFGRGLTNATKGPSNGYA